MLGCRRFNPLSSPAVTILHWPILPGVTPFTPQTKDKSMSHRIEEIEGKIVYMISAYQEEHMTIPNYVEPHFSSHEHEAVWLTNRTPKKVRWVGQSMTRLCIKELITLNSSERQSSRAFHFLPMDLVLVKGDWIFLQVSEGVINIPIATISKISSFILYQENNPTSEQATKRFSQQILDKAKLAKCRTAGVHWAV